MRCDFFILGGTFLAALVFFPEVPTWANPRTASTNALITTTVLPSFQVGKENDLIFAEARPGDPAQEIVAGDSRRAAGFRMSGKPYQAYLLTLPAEAELVLGGGEADDTRIRVNHFRAGSGDTGGMLTDEGNLLQRIGAKREALQRGQKTGFYRGAFLTTVVYP